MRFPATSLLAVLLTAAQASAQVQTFPYEAVVASPNAAVHSGPGERYYATGHVQRGTSVTVHRHDPGGWYVIAPPPGSFSWIRAEYVRRIDSRRGELTANNVVVRVGSSLDDSCQVEQVRLSTGDPVEILGEATLNPGPGPTRMFKIRPPRGEFRWIHSRHLIPADPIVREQYDRNPFAVPSTAKRGENGADGAARPSQKAGAAGTSASPAGPELPGFDRPIARSTGPAVRQSGPDADELAADRTRLGQLDERFRQIIQREIATWDFAALERDYRGLQAQASLPAIASQVGQRLDAIERYRHRKHEHDEVMRLISDTSRRDAEIRAGQGRQGPSGTDWQSARPAQPVAAPAVGRIGPPSYGPSAVPHAPGPHPAQAPRFDAAGVLERAATTYAGAPRYVLLAPNGRLLFYLEPAPGVNLESWIGQSVGVSGPRQHRRDVQAEVIVVRGLSPVRLVPAQ